MAKYILGFLVFCLVSVGLVQATGNGIDMKDIKLPNIAMPSCSNSNASSSLILMGKGNITDLGIIINGNASIGEGQIHVSTPKLNVDYEGYVVSITCMLDGVQRKIDNPNVWSGKFFSVYDTSGQPVKYIEENKYYYIYRDGDRLVFSQVQLVKENGKIVVVNQKKPENKQTVVPSKTESQPTVAANVQQQTHWLNLRIKGYVSQALLQPYSAYPQCLMYVELKMDNKDVRVDDPRSLRCGILILSKGERVNIIGAGEWYVYDRDSNQVVISDTKLMIDAEGVITVVE